VHGKGSLIGRMPGDEWQKFANLRCLLGYMFAQPGKKLLFMGCEFGQVREWNHDDELDWHLLDRPMHAGLQRWVTDLNTFYRDSRASHATDFDAHGFEWVDADDSRNSVLTWLRGRPGETRLLIAVNFTPVVRDGYRIGVPAGGTWTERLNSDAGIYGGTGVGNLGAVESSPEPWHGRPDSIVVTLPPLGILVFEGPPVPAAQTAADVDTVARADADEAGADKTAAWTAPVRKKRSVKATGPESKDPAKKKRSVKAKDAAGAEVTSARDAPAPESEGRSESRRSRRSDGRTEPG
jgi:1,4-alpha-glucan branching enzyme